jgi:hypothetical protein
MDIGDYFNMSQIQDSSHRTAADPGTACVTQSKLLRLPGEIRNLIYKHLFETHEPRIEPGYRLPGLLTTCRQIYLEATSLYYGLTPAFRCLHEASTVSWLRNLSRANLRLLRHLKYDTMWIILTQKSLEQGTDLECQLFRSLLKRLPEEACVDAARLSWSVSFYLPFGARGRGEIRWTNQPDVVIELMRNWRYGLATSNHRSSDQQQAELG